MHCHIAILLVFACWFSPSVGIPSILTGKRVPLLSDQLCRYYTQRSMWAECPCVPICTALRHKLTRKTLRHPVYHAQARRVLLLRISL